tara:strand:+ start:456 stop:623 length:168 start_codon:yes stop_codon:yes gene_type:complete
MEKTKLFYKDENGEDTFLIAEGEDEAKAAENAVKEYQKLNLPITNITRMDKIIDD